MTTFTHKISFQKVFRGSQLHYDRLNNLLVKCNRLQIHTTHFSKYYLLNCPPANQKPLHKDALEAITSELNKLDNNNPRGSGDRRALVDHFLPFIAAYKNLINYEGEGVRNFQQLSTYMSETFETNIKGKNVYSLLIIINSFYLVNVQKNFVKKIKTLITELIIKRNRPQPIIQNLPPEVKDQLKLE